MNKLKIGDHNKKIKTNLRIKSFREGDNLWQKYKNSRELRYHMSQTNTKLMTSRAHLQIQQTHITPDSVQPSAADLMSRRSSVKFKSGRGRAPEYLFAPEKYMIRREKQYLRDIYECKLQMRKVKQMDKLRVGTQHTAIINAVGPSWYQEPSNKQILYAEKISETVQIDKKLQSVKNTMFVLMNLGLMPLPSECLVWKSIEYCNGDAVEFLVALFRLTNPYVRNFNNESYSINDRIILSALTHLALPATLREMHIRIPSPPPTPKLPQPETQLIKKKMQYASPYLTPLSYKPVVKKPFVIDTNLHPNLPYFKYVEELKKLQLRSEFPEKSEYKFKNKTKELDQLVESVLNKKIYKTKICKQICDNKNNQENTNTEKIISKVKTQSEKSKPKEIKHANKNKRKRTRRSFKKINLQSFLQEIYTYYPIHELDRQPTHTVIGGTQNKKSPVIHIEGISKMDYHRRIYRYVIGGIAVLRDGDTVPIINTVQYEPIKDYCTHIHGGVTCNEDGIKTKVITGVSAKEVPDDIPEPEPKPKPISVKPYCQCVALYNNYIRLKELEHQKCLSIYRQFVITKQKKLLKAQPEITYIIGGVTETKDGPVYTLSGIQPPKNQMFEPVVTGVVTKENEEPTLIVSGLQATRLYYDYMQTVKESLKNVKETSYLISGVTTAPDGTSTFIISGVSIQQPQIKPVEYAVEGVYDSESNTVIVTDEGVTNPWLQTKYTTIISGIKPGEDGSPVHIVQGLAKTGYEDSKFTYVLGGIKETDAGDPLFVISGVKDGVQEEEIIKPKCEYLIGGVQIMPDNRKTLIVQGLVLSRDEIPQRCTYVIGGIKILSNGDSVPIIQQIIPVRPIDCECLLLYRKYMELQKNKHGKCLELYERYVKKLERDEKEAFKERMKPRDATYIIGNINTTAEGDPRLIITGLAAKKIFDEYIKEPPVPQEYNRIIGGTYVDKKTQQVYYYIQGCTYAGTPKKPFVIIGGVKENIDGTPTYQISGVQALPEVKESICDFFKKKKHLEREKVMIIGAVKPSPDGTKTFVIDGVTTIDLWEEDKDEEPEPFMCKCMRIYKRWMELELKEYDEEIIENVGRRVEDIIIPFIREVPETPEPVLPNTVKILPMPKKYYKISCIYRKQIALLKKTLKSMADDGYPLALLPKVWLLPHFRIWMDKRCGRILNENDRRKYLRKSRTMWNHVFLCNQKFNRPKIPLSKETIKTLTWNKVHWARRKLGAVSKRNYSKIKEYLVENNRELWPTTMPYDFPCKTFLDVFYAYGPACKPDVLAFRPWSK